MRVVALPAVAGVLSLAAGAGPVVSTLTLPSRASFETVATLGNRLLLSGSDATGNDCDWLVVGRNRLQVKSSFHVSCEQPPLAGEAVVPAQFDSPTSNQTTVRIARPATAPQHVTYGPVVMSFPEISDTRLEWTYGPGLLWLYDVATTRGAEVVEVSTATGRVVRTVPTPKLVRPLLAADADGLWIAASVETATGTPAPTYGLAPAAGAPRLIHRGGYAAFWLVASGHTVWEDIATMTRQPSTVRQEIWRFNGSSAAAHALANANTLSTVTTPAVAPGSSLWTVSNGPFQTKYFNNCAGQRIVRIDGLTGHQTVVTTIQLPGNPCYPLPGVAWQPTGADAQTFVGGAFYFLAQTAGSGTNLYRVEP
jgi:hypothetical protein